MTSPLPIGHYVEEDEGQDETTQHGATNVGVTRRSVCAASRCISEP